MLKLFYSPNACSLASHIALEEAGAAYEVERVDFKQKQQRSPDYLRINPKGRVPALATDRGVLTESPAILGYIAQSFPERRLAELDDSFAFAEMQGFNLFLATTVHVAFAHVFRPERYALGEAAAEAMKARAPDALDEAFALIEAKLSDGRPFVHGAEFTVSDPYLYVFSRWFRQDGYGRPERCTRVMAHLERMQGRPGFRAALEQEGLEPA